MGIGPTDVSVGNSSGVISVSRKVGANLCSDSTVPGTSIDRAIATTKKAGLTTRRRRVWSEHINGR